MKPKTTTTKTQLELEERTMALIDKHLPSCSICRRYFEYINRTNQKSKSPIMFGPLMEDIYSLLNEKIANSSSSESPDKTNSKLMMV
jgi:hypothetical protein